MGVTVSRTQTDPPTPSSTLPSDQSSASLNHPHSAPDLLASYDPMHIQTSPSSQNSSSQPDTDCGPSTSTLNSLQVSSPAHITDVPSSPHAVTQQQPQDTVLPSTITNPSRPLPQQQQQHSFPSGLLPSPSRVPSSSSSEDYNLLPTVFTWSFDADSVHVAGSWDSWRSKTPLYKDGSEHLALLYLPLGEHHFKFFVDSAWQCSPNLPTRADCHGNTNNVLIVCPTEYEFDTAAPLHEQAPPSPVSSYVEHTAPPDFTSSSDPPQLPPQLDASFLKPLPEDISPSVTAAAAAAILSRPWLLPPRQQQHQNTAQTNPDETPLRISVSTPSGRYQKNTAQHQRPFFSHVFIDHLYQTRPPTSDCGFETFSLTRRIGSKVINTVLIRSTNNDKTSESETRPP